MSILKLQRGYDRHASRSPTTGSHTSGTSARSLSPCNDTITPAPPVLAGPDMSKESHHLRQRRRQQPKSDLLSSRRSSLDHAAIDPHWQLDDASGSSAEEDETARLWQRMLELQRRFRCYNSARMDAAVEDERMRAIVPPRSCLDLLNDSIAALPEETQRELDDFLERLDGPERRKHRIWAFPVGLGL